MKTFNELVDEILSEDKNLPNLAKLSDNRLMSLFKKERKHFEWLKQADPSDEGIDPKGWKEDVKNQEELVQKLKDEMDKRGHIDRDNKKSKPKMGRKGRL